MRIVFYSPHVWITLLKCIQQIAFLNANSKKCEDLPAALNWTLSKEEGIRMEVQGYGRNLSFQFRPNEVKVWDWPNGWTAPNLEWRLSGLPVDFMLRYLQCFENLLHNKREMGKTQGLVMQLNLHLENMDYEQINRTDSRAMTVIDASPHEHQFELSIRENSTLKQVFLLSAENVIENFFNNESFLPTQQHPHHSQDQHSDTPHNNNNNNNNNDTMPFVWSTKMIARTELQQPTGSKRRSSLTTKRLAQVSIPHLEFRRLLSEWLVTPPRILVTLSQGYSNQPEQTVQYSNTNNQALSILRVTSLPQVVCSLDQTMVFCNGNLVNVGTMKHVHQFEFTSASISGAIGSHDILLMLSLASMIPEACDCVLWGFDLCEATSKVAFSFEFRAKSQTFCGLPSLLTYNLKSID